MKKFLLAFLIAALLVPAFSYAQSGPESRETALYKKYDALHAKGGSKAVLLQTNIETAKDNPGAFKNAWITADWLRDNTILYAELKKPMEKYDSVYNLIYAGYAYGMAQGQKNKNEKSYNGLGATAVLAYYGYELIAGADSLRCADPTAAMKPFPKERHKAFEGLIKDLSPELVSSIWNSALQYEENVRGRAPNKDICSKGGTIEANFVTDAEWLKRRDTSRRQLTKIWAEQNPKVLKLINAHKPRS